MIRRPWVLTAWATMAALACRAALVVDWGGNYVSANQSFANSDATRIENVEIALSVRMQGPGTVLLLR